MWLSLFNKDITASITHINLFIWSSSADDIDFGQHLQYPQLVYNYLSIFAQVFFAPKIQTRLEITECLIRLKLCAGFTNT